MDCNQCEQNQLGSKKHIVVIFFGLSAEKKQAAGRRQHKADSLGPAQALYYLARGAIAQHPSQQTQVG
jgi:hypothetical protein